MRISSIILPAVLFVGLFVGMNSFAMDYYDRMDVDAEGFEGIEDEQERLESDWTDQASDESTFDEREGIRERVAGALFVPRIVGDVFAIRSVYSTVVDEVAGYEWVPGWATTLFRTVVSVSLFIAVLSLAVRHYT